MLLCIKIKRMSLETQLRIFLKLFLLTSAEIWIVVAVLTKEEFNLAVTANGYSAPKDEVYHQLIKQTGNFSREELSMFIAQLIHESGGFKHTEQLECTKGNRCVGHYTDGVGLANKSYHGRGYIQLTWGANYWVASHGLGMGDRLVQHPELVARDKRLAMLVSVWYWRSRVNPLLRPGVEDHFGITTKAINPGECPALKLLARRRYHIYLKVAEALKIKNKAKEDGCYD